MRSIKGNIIDLAKQGLFDVIVHGANCQHKMGSGLALQIKTHFPEAYRTDLETPLGSSKLGTVSFTNIFGYTKPFYVVNAYTQDRYGRDRRHTDYDAVRSCFKQIKQMFHKQTIAYPSIGCKLGGGDWSVVSDIIKEELKGENHIHVIF